MAQDDIPRYLENFLFPNVFKTFRIAVLPGRLFTAFLGIAVIFAAGALMDLSRTVIASGDITPQQLSGPALTGTLVYPTELNCYINAPERTGYFLDRYKDKGYRIGVSRVLGYYLAGRFNGAVTGLAQLRLDKVLTNITGSVRAVIWALKYHTVYSIIMFLIILTCLSITGEAICRGAALQFSRDEKPGIGQCIRFSLRKFVSLFCAPLAPMILLLSIGLFVMLIGLLTNIPYAGEIITALLFIFIVLAGMFMAATIVWIIAGGGLMYPVIAFENSDTFDAISKSFSYVFSRPWRMALYSALGMIYGAVCYLFVRFFVFLILLLSRGFLEMAVWVNGSKTQGMNKISLLWPEPHFLNLLGGGAQISRSITESIGAFLIHIGVLCLAGIVAAFVVSFYFSLNTVIYCLLRKSVDKTPIEEIYVEAEEPETIETESQ